MKNFVQHGRTLTLAAPSGGILSGVGLLAGSVFGIANCSGAEGDPVECDLEGVFDIAKTASQTFAVGAKVYWDNTAKSVTAVSSGNSLIGAATAAAGGSDPTARVRLNGITI
jgi:predicted RecA/RadA family phage recombinase